MNNFAELVANPPVVLPAGTYRVITKSRREAHRTLILDVEVLEGEYTGKHTELVISFSESALDHARNTLQGFGVDLYGNWVPDDLLGVVVDVDIKQYESARGLSNGFENGPGRVRLVAQPATTDEPTATIYAGLGVPLATVPDPNSGDHRGTVVRRASVPLPERAILERANGTLTWVDVA